jgi:predicted ABC-type ATPase
MNSRPPIIVVIAGPNGAGKTTASEELLRNELAVSEFVNADVIARGLSGFEPERAAMAAGRIMLSRLNELADQGADFAFETTLASRTFAPWLARRMRDGYEFHLCFVWLPSPEIAIARVAARVRAGGHDIPTESIRRRYGRGIKNLFELYLPIATNWAVLHGAAAIPARIAWGGAHHPTEVLDSGSWAKVLAQRNDPET